MQLMRATTCCVLGAVLAVSAASCTSTTSRKIGNPQNLEEVGGMPISVNRSRWLRVTYNLVTYGAPVEFRATAKPAAAGEGGLPAGFGADAGTAPDIIQYQTVQTVCEIVPEIIDVPVLYAIDFKRPLIGSIDASIEWPKTTDPGADKLQPYDFQYPVKIGATVKDKTIQELTKLVPDLFGVLGLSISETDRVAADLVPLQTRIQLVEFYDLRHSPCQLARRFRPKSSCACIPLPEIVPCEGRAPNAERVPESAVSDGPNATPEVK